MDFLAAKNALSKSVGVAMVLESLSVSFMAAAIEDFWVTRDVIAMFLLGKAL